MERREQGFKAKCPRNTPKLSVQGDVKVDV